MSSIQHKINSLTEGARNTPEYADIVPLFIEIFRYTEGGGGTGISINVNPSSMLEKIKSGAPLISPDDFQVDEQICQKFLTGAIETLKRCGKAGVEELAKVSDQISNGKIICNSIFRAILSRDRKTIDEIAVKTEIPSPLLEYLFEIPLKHSLELYAETVGVITEADWDKGYCPVCGSRAGMAEFVGDEGKRHLCCSACNFSWPFKRLQCPFCGNDDPEKLTYFTAGDGATRVDACKACSRYIKTRDSRKGGAETSLDVEDLLTLHLDLLAAKEGFERGK